MTTEEVRLKVQALVDNELPEDEIPVVLAEIEASYELRTEYVALLRLRKRLGGAVVPEPSPEWFEKVSRRRGRTALSMTGMIFFAASYLLLIVYAVASLFRSAGTAIWVKVGVIGLIAGFGIYLAMTVMDRIRESKTDKYKGVMR